MKKSQHARPCALCGQGVEEHEVCIIERTGKPTLEAYMCPGVIDSAQYEEMTEEAYNEQDAA